MLRALLGGMAAFALAVGGVSAAAADDAPIGGSIAGTVTSAVDGSALEGIRVHAETDNGLQLADGVTDETGAYVLDDLIAGDYVVLFSAADGRFIAEYWNDTRERRLAQHVAVTDGSASTGIDAALTAAPTGSISGTVTNAAGGAPVADAMVTASGEAGSWASAFVDSSGAYTLSGLAADSYVVTFIPTGANLKREYWENATDYAQATPVVIGDGTAVTGIDAALSTGASISGVVTRADDGTPIGDAVVSALDARNEIVGSVQTTAGGQYDLGGLPAGSYRLRFGSPDPALASEYWQNTYDWSTATPISVTEQQSVTGIDAALEAVGYISGTVTKSADGSPVLGSVTVYSAQNQNDVLTTTFTGMSGAYRIPVPPGTFKVSFAALDTSLLAEYWDDASSWQTATPVTVVSGDETTGIDAQLGVASRITGTVALDSTEDREEIVEAWDGSERIGYAYVDLQTGAYSMNVPAGTYILKASASFYNDSPTRAEPQFFDGVATAEEATPVAVGLGETIDGIDFTLIADTDPEPEPKPALALGVGSVRAGGDIAISGTGFAPGEKISFELHSDPIALGSLTADAQGVLKGSLRIPASAPVGAHTLVALNAQSVVVASAALQVTAASSQSNSGSATGDRLANTGSEAPTFAAMMALGLLAAGLVLVRRRRVGS